MSRNFDNLVIVKFDGGTTGLVRPFLDVHFCGDLSFAQMSNAWFGICRSITWCSAGARLFFPVDRYGVRKPLEATGGYWLLEI